MSEKNWTPEPWFSEHTSGVDYHEIAPKDENGEMDWEQEICATVGNHEANAGRIVAAVNGCAGIPKPDGLGELVKAVQVLLRDNPLCDCVDEYGAKMPRCDACKTEDVLRACGIEAK